MSHSREFWLTKMILIPAIESKYSAEEIATILWDYNIAQPSQIMLIPQDSDQKYKTAYIMFDDPDKKIHPIVKTMLDKGKHVIVDKGGENWALLKHLPTAANPFRETNAPPDPYPTFNVDLDPFITKIPDEFFESLPKSSLSLWSSD